MSPALAGGAGDLDSNHWRTEGIQDAGASTAFGDTPTNARYGQGIGVGNDGGSGLWAFDVSNGGTLNRTLGFTPNTLSASGTTIFNPGALELRVRNDTSSTVTGINFVFDIFVFNDRGSEYQLDFGVYLDGEDKVNDIRPAGSLTTDAGRDNPPASNTWQAAKPQSGSVWGLNWTTGNDLIFRWAGTNLDALETNFDELALDNIRITTAIPEPSTYALIFGALVLLGEVVVKRRTRTTVRDHG